jgi:two-component system sensor histidine kinase HydH
VHLNDVVRNVMKLYEAQFSGVGRPPITTELHLDEALPVIQADPVLLQRAIENLILNAMDAMPGGGMLALTTSHRDAAVRLEVSDSGAGLTAEECHRLFTPYYTTKQHGTGLGLAIVQSVVSDHGGTISVDSEAGVGTTFRIELPVSHREHHEPVAPPAPENEAKVDNAASGNGMDDTTIGTDSDNHASSTEDTGAGTPAPVEEK